MLYEPRKRSLGELLSDLADDARTLVRLELKLARAEMTDAASRLMKEVAYIAAGGFIGYAAFLVLAGAFVALLALLLPFWLASLVVGLLLVGLGYFLIQRGLDGLKHLNPKPTKTIRTLEKLPTVLERENGAGGAATYVAPKPKPVPTPASDSGFAAYDEEFRRHYEQHFAGASRTFGQYVPAYYYGYKLGVSPYYSQRTWSEIEPEVRRRWEAKNPGSWDKARDAVRHAWEEARTARV